MNNKYEEYAKIFKVFTDAKRLKIIEMLSDGELCACKIQEQFNITQPTLSHDMKLLCDTGIVLCRKEGRWCYYSLDNQRLDEILDIFNEIRHRRGYDIGTANI